MKLLKESTTEEQFVINTLNSYIESIRGKNSRSGSAGYESCPIVDMIMEIAQEHARSNRKSGSWCGLGPD